MREVFKVFLKMLW